MIYIRLGGVELQEANEVWRESASRPNVQACAFQNATKLVRADKHDLIIVPGRELRQDVQAEKNSIWSKNHIKLQNNPKVIQYYKHDLYTS